MTLRDRDASRAASARRGCRATALVLALACGAVACGNEPADHRVPSKSPSGSAVDLSKPADAVDLDLSQPHSTLEGLRNDASLKYQVFGDQNGTDLVIRDGRLERSPASASGPLAAPALVFQAKRPVRALSATYRFTDGDTAGENAVIGTCDVSFAQGSIQFYVSPVEWALFYTVRKTDRDRVTPIVPIEEGTFAQPLKRDGATDYDTTMRVDLDSSSVTVKFPGGTRTFTDPHIKKLWGDKAAVQVRRPNSTDGDITFTKVWSWAP